MRRHVFLVATLGLFWLGSLQTISEAIDRSSVEAMSVCRQVSNDEERLACYDAAVLRLTPPNFEGRLSQSTEPFEVFETTRLRFQSDGVIFVLYLKDAEGEVLQNLHIGGGGEGTHIIEIPGIYSLQINGSESWRVWLEQVRNVSEGQKVHKKGF